MMPTKYNETTGEASLGAFYAIQPITRHMEHVTSVSPGTIMHWMPLVSAWTEIIQRLADTALLILC